MGQVSAKLRSTTDGFAWWCPACGEAHPLPYKKGWTWNGDLTAPTFTPSFRHGPSIQAVHDDKGRWLGLWLMRDKDGNVVRRAGREPGDTPIMWCCHYIVTGGRVAYCGDSTHAMAGKTIDMPDLPPFLRDGEVGVDDF